LDFEICIHDLVGLFKFVGALMLGIVTGGVLAELSRVTTPYASNFDLQSWN
jgi:hypothetical protein